jgi:hypothetical protein
MGCRTDLDTGAALGRRDDLEKSDAQKIKAAVDPVLNQRLIAAFRTVVIGSSRLIFIQKDPGIHAAREMRHRETP